MKTGVRAPLEGQAPRGASEPLSPLAVPWEPQPLGEALKGNWLEWEERPGVRRSSSVALVEGERVQEVGWVPYRWAPPTSPRSQPPHEAGIATIARRLMALERRKMRRLMAADYWNRRPRKAPRAA